MGKGGNGKQGKGVSKDDIAFAEAIKQAMPQMALERGEARLVPSEWSVPTRPHTEISAVGGVCLAPKPSIPAILERCGYTHTTQSPFWSQSIQRSCTYEPTPTPRSRSLSPWLRMVLSRRWSALSALTKIV
eukprot:6464314-Amphidinium_carterae.1